MPFGISKALMCLCRDLNLLTPTLQILVKRTLVPIEELETQKNLLLP